MVKLKKKVKKKKLPSIPVLKKRAQALLNGYIRERDKLSDTEFKCIVCEKILPMSSCNSGHFFGTKKYGWMRFLEDNMHAECSGCNNFNHESLIFYTLNLPKKIGQERFDALLEISKHRPEKDFTRDELNEIFNKLLTIK